jgi:hypothetical protein
MVALEAAKQRAKDRYRQDLADARDRYSVSIRAAEAEYEQRRQAA